MTAAVSVFGVSPMAAGAWNWCTVPAMEEDRFTRIETKIAYHENDIAELNKVIYRQQRDIEQLQTQLTRMNKQLSGLGLEGDPDPDQKPPHY
jgi:uncharacterized coiled-coil protein SlyX